MNEVRRQVPMTQFQVELQKRDKSNVLRSKKTRNKVPHNILKRFKVKKKVRLMF